jgi:hypothetical protein
MQPSNTNVKGYSTRRFIFCTKKNLKAWLPHVSIKIVTLCSLACQIPNYTASHTRGSYSWWLSLIWHFWVVTPFFLENKSNVEVQLQISALSFKTPGEQGQHSWYGDWLWSQWPRCRSSSPGRVNNFLFCKSSRLALGSTQPSIQWVPRDSSGVKRPGREADHSPPTSAEVKKMWIYTSTPPLCLHGIVLN